jgi:hypothetical protein
MKNFIVDVGTPGKVFLGMKMRCAAVFVLISLAFTSQAFAFFSPPFPVKPAPPFNGEVIVIADDSMPNSARKSLLYGQRWLSSISSNPERADRNALVEFQEK